MCKRKDDKNKTKYWWVEDEKQKKGWTKLSREGWYNTREWRELRQLALSKNPLCAICLKEGKLTPAKEVNHIVPAEKDKSKFFELSNLQPLCSFHHRSVTRKDNSKYGYEKRKQGEALKRMFETKPNRDARDNN